MTNPTQVELGSPLSLTLFHAWCRVAVAWRLHEGSAAALLFADGPDQEQPVIAEWEIKGALPETTGFLTELIEGWMAEMAASQIAISIPYHGGVDGVLLLCVDETGHIAERATIDDDGFLGKWRELPPGGLPFGKWQRLLATYAGYRDFTKWRCRLCESVCAGEADEIPSPCDFCGSQEIEAVSIETPLSPPRQPFVADYEPDELELFTSPFGMTLLGVITGGAQG
jgi:hypothetical protein